MKSIIYYLLFVAFFGSCAQVYAQTPEKNDNVVFTIVEHMPEFPGGDEAMAKFLQKNIVYPESVMKANIQGKVYLSFVVDEKGNVRDAKILRGVHELLDAEALRVINLMPRWKPGTQGGRPVRVQFNLPIDFKL